MSSFDGQFNSSISSNLSLQMAQVLEDRSNAERDSTHCCYRLGQITAVSIGEEGEDAQCIQIDTASPMGSVIKCPESPSYPYCHSIPSPGLEGGPERASVYLDFSVSPLTSSSYHTMERFYDQDTWRMHNRIAASRIDWQELPGTRLCMPNEMTETLHRSSQSPQVIFERDDEEIDGDDDDDGDLEIFDFDLDES